ncbi:AAA family ATPase [Oceanomicrobium pacificus]|uniref:AAA family ATPase n=1 Tax=Oceanomicrobium pacificus TaxID=2692916 RepID=A0A6B0TVQ1_9RHOB|nr:ATP-binding protein [Oceanomicrobium pacificus]MXU65302.1 AAA family ATPase [Oceanomicrobium pacificus]
MTRSRPVLHLFCGKAASGKSTLAARIAAREGALLVSEDGWLHTLFGPDMRSLDDYVARVARLRAVLGPHLADLLGAGQSVVLDAPANTVATRDWMRGLLDASGADHMLHVIDVPDDVCLARLRARNASGNHPFTLSETQFKRLSQHFVPPAASEGFKVEQHNVTG